MITPRKSFRTPFVIAASLLVLSACTANPAHRSAGYDTVMRANVQMVRLPFAIKAEADQTDSISEMTLADIKAFLSDVQISYGDTIVLDAGEGVAGHRMTELTMLLDSAGLAVGKPGVYGAQPASGEIMLYVERYRAEVPKCRNWSEPSSVTRASNSPSPNFGCSNNASLAAMVANPRDLTTGVTAGVTGGAKAGRSHSESAVQAVQRLNVGDQGQQASSNR